MADKKDSAGPASIGKKPTPIIDLTATVVETSKPAVETRAAFAFRGNDAATGASAAPQKPADKAAPAQPERTTSERPAAAAASAATKTAAAAAVTSAAITATPTTASARGGLLSHLAAGIAGGVLSLVGATQLLPGAQDTTTQRLADLEQKITRAAAPDASAKLGAAEARLAKLEEAAQALESGQVKIATEMKSVEDKAAKAANQAGAATGSVEKLAKLEEQLAQMVAAANANPQGAGRLPQLAQLTSKIGDVETALVTRTAQVKTDLMQQMDQRFAKTGETLETTRSTLSQRTQSIEQSLKAVTDETASLRAGMDGVKVDLDKRFAAAAKPADVQTAVASVATKVTSLEQNMQNVVKSEQERNATAGNILLSLELANLKRALDRGGKYAAELGAVKALAGGKLDLAVLEAQQNTGVPSLATLGQELAGAAHAMLDAEAEPVNASVSDRLLSGVKSIVRVRKVDFAPADQSTEALIARMEKALKEGRIADVIEESKKLSPKAAAPAAKWLERINSRAAIDTALAALDSSLKTSLAGGAAPKKVAN